MAQQMSEISRAVRLGVREITDFTVVVSYLTGIELQSEEEVRTLRGLLNAVRHGKQLIISSAISDELLNDFKNKALGRVTQ